LDGKETRDSLVSPAQLQAWLGCGRTKTYELLQTGEIPSYRVGRLVRVRRDFGDPVAPGGRGVVAVPAGHVPQGVAYLQDLHFASVPPPYSR
jgi:excisionase family DNA binding protein